MTINLQKGQHISLSKEAPNLSRVMCGLGWDIAKRSGGGFFNVFDSGSNYDLDSSVICLNSNGKLNHSDDVIYFGNLRHRSDAIFHQGDNLTGAGEGDDEIITIDLLRLPANISKLIFVVNIYDCIARKQDFSQIENAFVRLVDTSNKRELARYNLSGKEYVGMTGTILAEIYRHNNEWKMTAVGKGIKLNNLGELSRSYT